MYDVKQFRPTLYFVLILGISGFALASQSAGLWVLAIAAILFHAWLIRTDRFVPMPRIVANTITLLMLLFAFRQALNAGSTGAVLAIGQFLVLLQLVKLYELRANRDYAQLLVLSLLLMVAALISTASLIFALLLVAYLFLSLYCSLLFHLKVEADYAKFALADAPQKLSPTTLRQDQRYLSRSMRRLTGLVSSVSVTCAVLVFLLFPRGNAMGLFGSLQFRPSQSLTGFSDTVSFQNIAKISQNDEKVAEVYLTRNDKPVRGTETLLLRGVTLDIYEGDAPERRGAAWTWTRSNTNITPTSLSAHTEYAIGPPPAGADRIKQSISLHPTGTKVLFAVPGPFRFNPARAVNQFAYVVEDQTLQTVDPLVQNLDYTVTSCDVITAAPPEPSRNNSPSAESRAPDNRSPDSPPSVDSDGNAIGAPRSSRIDPKVREFAMNPDVTGADAQGPLAPRRGAAQVTPLDEQIATNIERYLQRNFTYTLDLNDARRIIYGQDPLIAFLYQLKRGHCEYFAGAMTLMCQSLGMQSRLVVGFKCDEYNTVGGYYQVRQSHAHAWVEVLTPGGIWKTFDPTSGRDAPMHAASLWTRTKHIFDYLEFKWANTVVAYDGDSRDNLWESTKNKITNAGIRSDKKWADFREWLEGDYFVTLSSRILVGLVAFMIFALIVAITWFLIERWRMHRRAARIGLDSLPPADQLRLARQLGFYADLMLLLHRRNITRPRSQTPMEFSRSLTFLPTSAYQTILRLTNIFYKIRFGHTKLTPALQRRLSTAISDLSNSLPPTS